MRPVLLQRMDELENQLTTLSLLSLSSEQLLYECRIATGI